MACGTPVICADNSSLPEVVGKAGLMLDADDVQGVADGLRQLEASPQLRLELSDAGRERAKLFSWERAAEIVVETLCAAYARHSVEAPHSPPSPLSSWSADEKRNAGRRRS